MSGLIIAAAGVLAVLIRRQSWRRGFALYLIAAAVKQLLYRPGREWVVLYVDPIVMGLKCWAAVEVWSLLMIGVLSGAEWRALASFAATAIVWVVYEARGHWPTEAPIFVYNQIRLSVHLAISLGLGITLLWIYTQELRRIRTVFQHALIFWIYTAGFTWTDFVKADTLAEWEFARSVFLASSLGCLAVWVGQALLNRRYLVPQH